MLLFRAKQGVKGFIILSCGTLRRTMSGLSEDPKQGAISEALVKNLSFYWFCNHSCLATKSRWHPNWHHQHDAIVSRLWFCFCHKKSFFVSVWYPKLASHDVSTKLELTSFSLTWCIFRFPEFLHPFWRSRSDPGQKYWLEKYIPENVEAIWASSFKIRLKIELQSEQFSVCLTSHTSLFMSCDMFFQSVFQFGF